MEKSREKENRLGSKILYLPQKHSKLWKPDGNLRSRITQKLRGGNEILYPLPRIF